VPTRASIERIAWSGRGPEGSDLPAAADWPEGLRAALRPCMASPVAMAVLRGPTFLQLHNDAYGALVGGPVHGRPASDTWGAEWARLRPMLDAAVRDGTPVRCEGLRLTAVPGGRRDALTVGLACHPLRDDAGAVIGLFAVVVESGARMPWQRRSAFSSELGEQLRSGHGAAAMRLALCRALGGHLGAARVCCAEFEPDMERFVIRDDWRVDGAALSGRYRLTDWGATVADAVRAGRTLVIDDVATQCPSPAATPSEFERLGVRAGVFVPMLRHGPPASVMMVLEPLPRTWSPHEVSVVEEAAERGWEAIDRARFESRLRESEGRFRALADLSPDGILIDADDRIAYANDAAARLLGATRPEALLGRSPVEFFPRALHALVRERCAQAAGSAGEPAPVGRCRRLDGVPVDLELSAGPVGWEGGLATQLLIRDASVRKAVEDGLRERGARMSLLFDTARALLATEAPASFLDRLYGPVADLLDLDVYVHYGLSPDGVPYLVACRGLDPEQVASPDQAVSPVCGPVEALREPRFIEDVQWTLDPALAPIRRLGLRAYACFPLIARGRIVGALSFGSLRSDRIDADKLALIGAFSDLLAVAIERQRDRDALREGELHLQRADRAKTEFLAMLAHELRNPMAPLRNAVSLLERTSGDSVVAREALAIMRRQTAQLSRLVDDLLEVSRIEQGKIELRILPAVLADTLTEAIEAVAPLLDARRQRLETRLPDRSLRLPCDAARITQVVTNLLHNAVKFTPEGGTIHLGVEEAAETVAVVVVDEGVGIEPEMLPLVFDLFQQGRRPIDRAEGGLGIGLSLVRRLAILHGGSASAYSAGIGQGARFVVTLPRG
jgi:PAS domain S-box-containing protein